MATASPVLAPAARAMLPPATPARLPKTAAFSPGDMFSQPVAKMATEAVSDAREMVPRFMGGVVTISQPWCKLESNRLVRNYLFRDDVIVSPHFLIRARGADFHFLAGQLMEKERDSPSVAHLTILVDRQPFGKLD